MKLLKDALSDESSVFLNLIRLAACEMVVLGHFLTKYQPTPFDALFRLGSTLGGAAVLLFFVLSGLLISYSVLRKTENPQYGFRIYFVDRFSRIYSGLIPALILSAIIAAVIYTTNYAYYSSLSSMQSSPSALSFGMTLFMLDRFPVGFFNTLLSPAGLSVPLPEVTPFGFNGILWTLVVEWWIYMFFGALVVGSLALTGKRKKSLSYKVAICVATVLFGLLLVGFCGEFSSLVAVWFAGVLMTLALSSEAVKNRLSGNFAKATVQVLLGVCLAAAAFAVYATFAFTNDFYNVYLGLALSACVYLAVVLLNMGCFKGPSKLMMHKPTARTITIGAAYSYTLFLTHYPIIILLNGLDLPINRFAMLIPILLITNLVAFAVAYFTERKSRQLAISIKKWMHLPNQA
jgi:peptidoglycan/LPS O-acetylase OafA/YrhL